LAFSEPILHLVKSGLCDWRGKSFGSKTTLFSVVLTTYRDFGDLEWLILAKEVFEGSLWQELRKTQSVKDLLRDNGDDNFLPQVVGVADRSMVELRLNVRQCSL